MKEREEEEEEDLGDEGGWGRLGSAIPPHPTFLLSPHGLPEGLPVQLLHPLPIFGAKPESPLESRAPNAGCRTGR